MTGNLTQALAQQIASETTAIVGFNIVITDANGIVLGSGDMSRVGTLHEASLDVVRTRLPATHSAAEASALHGVKPGVTLPILLNGHLIGTVGITGSPAKVTRFGLLVERQTEILLHQASLLRTGLQHQRDLEDLVHEILAFDPEITEAVALLNQAREQAVDLTVSRVGIAVQINGRSSIPTITTELLPRALVLLRESFPHKHTIAVSIAANRYVVFAHPDGDGIPGIAQQARHCLEQFHAHLATDVEIGIGTEGVDPAGLRSSYEDAVDSLRLGRRLMHGFERVTTIDQVRIEQLLSSVSLRVRRRYATAVAAGLLTRGDWPTMRSTVVAWCESGFSLVGAARRLHVHRNTLIHRLEKIEELQGWSERSGQAYLALYLACKASEFEVDKSQAE
ncbi:CdaR family transcriptional regulator [Zafaria sp. Z1313]|uniref:CdaR family transcriptional regulator n=1 Tax=unclassified Zafaria TaxID=2828765 RepID=UPI002E792120|nr:sugar diacid recognition domain-containing protein [Zafaria sp. J156]MEE1622706.1 sugar diacid recognition domain-containing protein [Zafaria sp. J156]